MKKLLLVGLAILAFASFAFAQGDWHNNGGGMGHNGGGMGHNGGHNGGNGMMMGNCGNCYGYGNGNGNYNNAPAQPTVKDAAAAKTLVQTYIDANFKGYKVGAVTEFQGRKGTGYSADVTDASGNKFLFHVNPWGNVVGPMTNK